MTERQRFDDVEVRESSVETRHREELARQLWFWQSRDTEGPEHVEAFGNITTYSEQDWHDLLIDREQEMWLARADRVLELTRKPTLCSPRGFPLVCADGIPDGGVVLTVECYSKWYELFLITAPVEIGHLAKIQGIHFGMFDRDEFTKGESAYCDHAPNPGVVARFAAAYGYRIDSAAFEMIVGRWELEYQEHYDVESERRSNR